MSTDLQKFNPANLAAIIGNDALQQVNDEFSAGIASSDFLPMISIKGSRFRLRMDGDETVLPDASIEVFLITSRPNVSKMYYPDGYTAGGDNNKPTCSSADGQYPDSNIEQPFSPTCQLCPNNAWGSKISAASGKKIKACTDYKMIVLALTAMPEKAFALRIPAASLKPFAAYIGKLNLAGIPANTAKTKLSLDVTQEYPSLLFDYAGTVDSREQYEAVVALAQTIEVLNAVKVSPRVAATDLAPQQTAQQPVVVPPVAPAPAPVEEVKAEPTLAEILGKSKADTKEKKTRAKKTEEAAPAVETAPAPAPAPAAEPTEQITNLDSLLAKLKK
jgi:hypothetical protein